MPLSLKPTPAPEEELAAQIIANQHGGLDLKMIGAFLCPQGFSKFFLPVLANGAGLLYTIHGNLRIRGFSRIALRQFRRKLK